MTTGVIYARVSSIGDRQSTERQVKDLSEYAKYKGIEVCKVFEEHISGAKKNDERPVLCEAMEYCKANRIGILLVSELSRLGRNAFEVLASVKELIDCGINLYIQKEQLTLLDEEGHPSLFAPIMIATLSTCAQLERDNISFRLQSGRKRYIENGGKLGRKVGSVKTEEQIFRIRRNLSDAGCDEPLIEQFLELEEHQKRTEQYRLLSGHKRILLQKLHHRWRG